MPTYKLTYFPIMGLGEPIRFLLSYGGTDFIDNRIDRADWPALKLQMPFGQMPLLEVDGKRANQSIAICRYLGKQFGIAGKNDWEALEIDSVIDTITDVRSKIQAYYYESDPDIRKSRYEPLIKETIPFCLERLDSQVKKNGGWLVGNSITWADVYFVGLLDYLNGMLKQNIIEKYENLKKLRTKVLALPKIDAYVKKRPECEV